jgi:4-hydroxymandelate synthase
MADHQSRLSLNHIEFYVRSAQTSRDEFMTRLGFVPIGVIQHEGSFSAVVRRGRTIVVLTQGLTADHPATRYVQEHDDGVADIVLAVDDVRAAYDKAVRAGAAPLRPPRVVEGFDVATVGGLGDLAHTFVKAPPTAVAIPGLGDMALDRLPGDRIDHFAICVHAGELQDAALFCEHALGMRVIFEERTVVGSQAMRSKAVQSADRSLTFTIVEPEVGPGQIDEFLERHGGPGVQHVAISTEDIVHVVAGLAETGTKFLDIPAAYYDRLPATLQLRRHSIPELQRLGILVDEDQDGQLYQIFTRSTHPRGTYFFEFIERDRARTFGTRNITALYESVERDRISKSAGVVEFHA